MSVYKPKGSPYYHFDFWIKGDRFYGSTGKTAKRKAERVEAAEKTAALAELDSGSKRRKVSLDRAAEHYYDQVAKHQPSAPTTDYQIENLVRLIGSGTPLDLINDGVVADFVAHRRGEKNKNYKNSTSAPLLSPSTVNRELEMLKRVIRRATKILNAKTADIDWKTHILIEPDAPDRPLTEDQEDRLFSELVPHAVPIVEAALLLGQRKDDIVLLDWSRVDIKGRSITFMLKSRKPGGRSHVMPINETLLVLLANQGPKDSGPVFTYGPPCYCQFCKLKHNIGRPIKTIRRAWEGARRRAGLSGFRFHDLRHTVGSRILAELHDLKAAQDYLGHSDISTTLRYAHHSKDHKKTVMDALSGRNPRKIPEMSGKRGVK